LEKITVDKNITIFKDVITQEEADYILNIAKKTESNDWTLYGNKYVKDNDPPAIQYWEENVLKIDEIPALSEKYLPFLFDLSKRLSKIVEDHLKISFEEQNLKSDDYTILVRFQKGHFMKVHHDGGYKNLIKYGTVLYLNDDFTGGETFYPAASKELKPIARSLILHPGNEAYRHGVKEVTSGTRYILTSFIKKFE
jgi:2OG-Fe(II) oxygenase superfamily